MKIGKKQAGYAAAAFLVFALALVFTILEWAGAFTVCSHPVWMFFFVLAAGLGVLLAVQGLSEKSPFLMLLAAVLIVFAFSYALADWAHLAWWLIVLVDVVLVAFFVLVNFLRSGNKTEEIALNKSPDYKNYEERKAEREAQEKAEEENYVPPEIKSFKDDNK